MSDNSIHPPRLCVVSPQEDIWIGFAVLVLSLVMIFIPGLKDTGDFLLPMSIGWLMGVPR